MKKVLSIMALLVFISSVNIFAFEEMVVHGEVGVFIPYSGIKPDTVHAIKSSQGDEIGYLFSPGAMNYVLQMQNAGQAYYDAYNSLSENYTQLQKHDEQAVQKVKEERKRRIRDIIIAAFLGGVGGWAIGH